MFRPKPAPLLMEALPSPTTKRTFSLCGPPELGTSGGRASLRVTFASALPHPLQGNKGVVVVEGLQSSQGLCGVEDSVLLTLLKVDLSSTFSSSMAMRLVMRPVRVS